MEVGWKFWGEKSLREGGYEKVFKMERAYYEQVLMTMEIEIDTTNTKLLEIPWLDYTC